MWRDLFRIDRIIGRSTLAIKNGSRLYQMSNMGWSSIFSFWILVFIRTGRLWAVINNDAPLVTLRDQQLIRYSLCYKYVRCTGLVKRWLWRHIEVAGLVIFLYDALLLIPEEIKYGFPKQMKRETRSVIYLRVVLFITRIVALIISCVYISSTFELILNITSLMHLQVFIPLPGATVAEVSSVSSI